MHILEFHSYDGDKQYITVQPHANRMYDERAQML